MKKNIDDVKARLRDIKCFIKEMRGFFNDYDDKTIEELEKVSTQYWSRCALFVDKAIEAEESLQQLQEKLSRRDLI